MRFSLEQTILESVMNYLATKPYNEVAKMLSQMQMDLKPIEEIAEKPAS